ncbi:MAG: beta-ketoacyl-[acyl-carrier-protein] synthase family protein [Rhodocyclaceae bacterium]|nr:beta-ketoacyl-[acyl-carrier-protein] synthase family protein [Rhodocyclaceae bacterium]
MSGESARRVAITGLGVVSPWGSDVEEFFDRLLAGESAIRHHRTDDGHLSISMPAVHCPHFDATQEVGRASAAMDRSAQMSFAASNQAWQQAGLPIPEQPDRGAAVYWGTALAGTLTYEQGYREMLQKGRERVPPLSLILGMNNAAASHLAIHFRLGGPCLTYTIACASAAAAIGEAWQAIRDGRCRVALTGGADSPMSLAVVRAWEALRVLAPIGNRGAEAACRPFSKDRAGLVLAEGAAALVLEEWEHARGRGARILAELAGYGSTCDASHLVKPSADGQYDAMHQALTTAALGPGDIDYLNAHGTATREGDPIEIEAIRRLYGEHAPGLAVSATKSMHGHLMGATGATEALVCVQALRRNATPPTAHLAELEPACAGVAHVREAGVERPLRACMSNSFAFGGSNSVMVLRQAEGT